MLYHHRNFEMGVSKSFEMCLEDGSLCGLISCNISCHILRTRKGTVCAGAILRTRKDTVCAGTIQPKNDLGGNFWPPWPTLPLLTLLAAPCPFYPHLYWYTKIPSVNIPGTKIPSINIPGTNMPGVNILSWWQVTSGSATDIEILISLNPPHPQHIYAPSTPHPQHIYARVHHTHTQATIAVPTICTSLWVLTGLCYWCW